MQEKFNYTNFLEAALEQKETDDDRLERRDQESRTDKIVEEWKKGVKNISFTEICDLMIKLNPIYYDDSKIWWAWNKEESKWETVDEVDILCSIKKLVNINPILANGKKTEFFNALKVVARDNKPKDLGSDWIQFKNKIINFKTKEELEVSSEYFFTNPIPWNIGMCEDTPFIDRLIKGDNKSKGWVDEKEYSKIIDLFSYCLLRDYPIQRIFVLLGGGSNGKGSFFRMLRKIIGFDNCGSTDLKLLSSNRFENVNFFNKLMVEVSETSFNILDNTANIKRLTGGDTISVEFKGKNPFQYKNYAKLIIASNSLPITLDRTDGFYRRFLIVDFNNRFPDGKEIVNDISDLEFENFCFKIFNNLPKLLANCGFSNEGTISERRNRYEERSNPLMAFINTYCIREDSDFVVRSKFMSRFFGFLSSKSHRKLNYKEISGGLNSMGFESRKKRVDDSSISVIFGLRLKDDLDLFDEQKKVLE